jgi:hypothetical protein
MILASSTSTVDLLALFNGVDAMIDYLLTNVQDIAAQLVDTQVHGHRIRAE